MPMNGARRMRSMFVKLQGAPDRIPNEVFFFFGKLFVPFESGEKLD